MHKALCWLLHDWWGSLSTFLPRKPLPHLAGWKASRLSSGDCSGSPGEDRMFPPGFSCSVSGAHPCACRCPGTQASMLPVVGRSFLVLPYLPDQNLRGHFRWMAAFPSGLTASPCSLFLSPVFLMVNSSQLMPLLVKSHSSLQDANLIFFSFALKIAWWLLWLYSPSGFPWGDRLHAAHLCTHPRDMFPALWPGSCSSSDVPVPGPLPGTQLLLYRLKELEQRVGVNFPRETRTPFLHSQDNRWVWPLSRAPASLL